MSWSLSAAISPVGSAISPPPVAAPPGKHLSSQLQLVAHKLHALLPHKMKDAKLSMREQLKVGLAVHMSMVDGVSSLTEATALKIEPTRDHTSRFSDEKYPPVNSIHAQFLHDTYRDGTAELAQPVDLRDLLGQPPDSQRASRGDDYLFPRRVRVADAWRVLEHYVADKKKPARSVWCYQPGDIVEVRSTVPFFSGAVKSALLENGHGRRARSRGSRSPPERFSYAACDGVTRRDEK